MKNNILQHKINHIKTWFIQTVRFNKNKKNLITEFDIINKQFTMPVPNETIFGRDDETHENVTYYDIRKITNENKLIRLLRERIKVLFINQGNDTKQPFPKIILTCVSIETLGQIFIKENKNDTSFQFVSIINKFDKEFPRKFNKEFKKKLGDLWNSENDNVSGVTNLGKLIYKFLRNTMIHGFQGRGVYLTLEDTKSFIKEDGYLKLNPDWFWEQYKTINHELFVIAEKGQNNTPERLMCLKYINMLIN